MGAINDSVKDFVRTSTPAMALLDQTGCAVAVSRAFALSLGVTPGGVLGLPLERWRPRAPAGWQDAIPRALAGEVVRGEAEAVTHGDGSVRWIRWTAQSWCRPDEPAAGVVIVVDDVTESRRALHAAEVREGRLYQQVRALTGLSRSSRLNDAEFGTLAIEAAATIAGTLGVDRIDVWMVEPDLLRCVTSYDAVTQRHSTRAPVKRDDVPVLYMVESHNHLACPDIGSDAIMSTSKSLFEANARSVLLAGVSAQSATLGLIVCQSTWDQRDWSIEDGAFVSSVASALSLTIETTRRRVAEAAANDRMRQLDEARARAEAADRAKSEFLATMSHEIRTPMNGVVGFTNLLMDSRLDDEQRSFASTIKASADSLLTLINDILDFSKIEAGKFEFESLPFELEAVLGEVMELCSTRADDKGVVLALELPARVPLRFVGDAGRVRQVLLNLVGNAIKFTETGTVSVRVKAEGAGVRIEVADSGIGISQSAIARLFTRFSQADSSTTRKFGGTGLGLAIARRLVELMGGTIGVDSTLGAGSVFWFTLTGGETVGPQLASPTSSLRVLLVEPHTAVQRMWCETLSKWGVQPLVVDSEEAPQHLGEVDLVIVDESDGATLSAIRSLAVRPRVLLRTVTPRGDRPHAVSALIGRSAVRAQAQMRAMQVALEGTAFTFSVDRAATGPAGAQEDHTFHGVRVLVVDDNLINQRLAERLLTRRGCEVAIAVNGREAVAAWEAQKFDLILMDGHMPEMDGLEATSRIRAREVELQLARVPIVALTADAMQGDRQKFLEAGMDEYLTKPIRDERLVEVLRHFVPVDHRAAVVRAV